MSAKVCGRIIIGISRVSRTLEDSFSPHKCAIRSKIPRSDFHRLSRKWERELSLKFKDKEVLSKLLQGLENIISFIFTFVNLTFVIIPLYGSSTGPDMEK